jgi:diadenylate cyclase
MLEFVVINFFNNIVFVFQRFTWWSLVDVILLSAIFYLILRLLQQTQSKFLIRGIVIFALLAALFSSFSEAMPGFSWLISSILPALIFVIPVIFSQEIRKTFERLGRAGNIIPSRTTTTKETLPDELLEVIRAATRLSTLRHGALIVIERLDNLQDYTVTGVVLNAEISPELILQIFYPNTPLHDGAVLIKGEKLIAASCVMPLSSSSVLTENPDQKMGLRHRAALGISEVSDAIVVVVSEETGSISIAYNGRMIQRIDSERLGAILRTFFTKPEKKPLLKSIHEQLTTRRIK